MYEHFFGLRERPFDLTPNPRFLVLTESHREALSNLEYGIASRKGITLLIGEAGSGKTTIIRTAIERQPGRVHSVVLHNPTLTRAEFTEMLAVQFGLSDRAKESKARLLVELEDLLRQRREAGETSVMVVDEAQSLPLELLEEIRLLANIETADAKLLCVILAGQPELAPRLNGHQLRQLKQRVGLRCELRTLNLLETSNYVAGRIRVAGGDATHVFTREAVETMFTASRGIPRTVSVIADNALLGGFAAGLKPVTRQVVQEVCRDFDLGESAEPREGGDGFSMLQAEPSPPPPSVDFSSRPAAAAVNPTEPKEPDDPGRRSELRSSNSESDVKRSGTREMFGSYKPQRKRFMAFLRG